MGKLLTEDFTVSFEDIRSGHWPSLLKPYDEDALVFCQDWLNGRQTFLLQTSGSTGSPKTIRVRRAQMESSAEATGNFFRIKPAQHLLCCLNTAFIAGKMMLVRGMEWDSDLHLVTPSSSPFLSFGQDRHFDFAALVPFQLETSLEDGSTRNLLFRVRNLVIGGAPVSPFLRDRVAEIPGQIFQTYGMTETVSHVALADLKEKGPLVYQALPGVSLRQTEDGRLEIAAPMTDKQWVLTTDLVQMVPPNGFIWKGRSDYIINSGGIKIQPEELEAQISGELQQFFPGRSYLLGGKPDQKMGQKLVLLIEGPAAQTTGELLDALKKVLPAFHGPREIHFLEQFSQTPSGKINRKETLNFFFKKVF